MTSTAIATVEKMLESLPEEAQERVVEHLREYIWAILPEHQALNLGEIELRS